MKDMEANITPLKELQRCSSSYGSLEEAIKVWYKKRLLGRKRYSSRNSYF
jgi:hypothetical protein